MSDGRDTAKPAGRAASNCVTLMRYARCAPTRLKLVGLLRLEGPLTATQAARELGETPQRCTYHLGLLAKYGLVEEAGGGRGRERPWRATAFFTSWPNVMTEQETAAAGQMLEAVVIELHFEAVMGWVERKGRGAAGVAGGRAAQRRGALPDRGRTGGDGAAPSGACSSRTWREPSTPDSRPEGARPVTILNLAFPRRTPAEAAGG